MISKNDCLLLLADMKDNKEEAKEYSFKILRDPSAIAETISFINKYRQIDLSKFYQKLRKSYNAKKSKLYKNIVKEIEDPTEVIITLTSLLNQIMLFTKTCEDKQMFLRHSRFKEILQVLNVYYNTNDANSCIDLLKLIKIDLKVLEESLISQ